MDSWCWSLDPGQWSDKKKRPSLKKRRSKIKFPGKSDCIWRWVQRCQCHVSMTSEQWICSKTGRTETWMFFWSFTCWFLFSHQKTKTWLFFLSFFNVDSYFPIPGLHVLEAFKLARLDSNRSKSNGAQWVKFKPVPNGGKTKWVWYCSLKKSQAGGSESFLYFRNFHHLHYFIYSRMPEVQPLNLFLTMKDCKKDSFHLLPLKFWTFLTFILFQISHFREDESLIKMFRAARRFRKRLTLTRHKSKHASLSYNGILHITYIYYNIVQFTL